MIYINNVWLQTTDAYLLPSHAPTSTAPRPNASVRAKYTTNNPVCPERSRSMPSAEKVENVVKPPHKPVVRKRRASGLMPERADTL